MALAQAPAPNDPYLWLEEVESAQALDWVKAQSRSCAQALESKRHYKALYQDIRQIRLASDRAPFGVNTYTRVSDGYVWNYWQDAGHK